MKKAAAEATAVMVQRTLSRYLRLLFVLLLREPERFAELLLRSPPCMLLLRLWLLLLWLLVLGIFLVLSISPVPGNEA